MLSLSSLSGAALANEFDVVNSPTPELSYYIDDAGVLNKTTKKAINDRLYKLEVCCLADKVPGCNRSRTGHWQMRRWQGDP